ncbi:hypothetical protein Pmani_007450 [Petrolisthes manimaculis]|uniref:Uncharacterized protein n=1 Tax=Petrolisthes manimaculis TaxID=1843537 RepID=A0AAE1Q902_9EUCA|nr:hypothetical protein Pmani_007450 [Petrolisthes manimaculis]
MLAVLVVNGTSTGMAEKQLLVKGTSKGMAEKQLLVKGTSKGMTEKQLLGVLVGQVVEKHLPSGCHLVLMTQAIHSPIVPEVIRLQIGERPLVSLHCIQLRHKVANEMPAAVVHVSR